MGHQSGWCGIGKLSRSIATRMLCPIKIHEVSANGRKNIGRKESRGAGCSAIPSSLRPTRIDVPTPIQMEKAIGLSGLPSVE